MLAPGKKKTHRAYLWAYATTPYAELKPVVTTSVRGAADSMLATGEAS